MTCSYVQCIYVLPWLTRYSWPAPTCNVLMYCLGSCRYGWPAPTCNVLMYGLDTCRYGWPDSTCNALMYWLMQIRDQARRFITLVDELYNNKVIWNTLLHHLLCPRCSNGFLSILPLPWMSQTTIRWSETPYYTIYCAHSVQMVFKYFACCVDESDNNKVI